MIAAFVGDECRGVANAIRYDSSTTRHIAFLMVYSNRIEGDTLTFKLYNNEKQEISQLFNHVPFQPNAIYGTPTAPLRNLVEGKLTAYNFFSPNMDNRNDTWVIEYLPLYLDFEVSIYNSIGERLYNKKKFYQNDWNGTYKGDDLPNGTYYYIVKSPNGQFVYQGAISLIR
jgi:gliding motility-associated-like protein